MRCAQAEPRRATISRMQGSKKRRWPGDPLWVETGGADRVRAADGDGRDDASAAPTRRRRLDSPADSLSDYLSSSRSSSVSTIAGCDAGDAPPAGDPNTPLLPAGAPGCAGCQDSCAAAGQGGCLAETKLENGTAGEGVGAVSGRGSTPQGGGALGCNAKTWRPGLSAIAGDRNEQQPSRARRQEDEVRALLAEAHGGPAVSSAFFGGAVPRRRMSPQQAARARDLGMAVLVMTSKSFDVSPRTFVLAGAMFDRWLGATVEVRAGETSTGEAGRRETGQIEPPLACFVLACKFVETFAPRLVDVVHVVEERCSVEGLHEAEANVLAALGWDIDTVTGLDILHKLLSFATPRRAELLQGKAELGVQVAFCNRGLSTIAPGDLAVGALLNACDQQDLDEAFLDFVPPFMLTEAARAGGGLLKAFIAEHVQPRVASVAL